MKTKDGRKVSGFAAEYRGEGQLLPYTYDGIPIPALDRNYIFWAGHATEAMVKQILREDIEGIFNRRYSKDHEMEDIQYTIIVKEVRLKASTLTLKFTLLPDHSPISHCLQVEKSFGTVLASVCFASYIHPVLAMR